ncbi:MAG: hypothetical protein ACI4LQ_07345 [Anaerovoracaceae bacterium]
MKILKKLSATLLILVLVMSFSVGIALAEDGDNLPTKFRYFYNEGNCNQQEVNLSLANMDYRIDNITTSSSKLTAKLVRVNVRESSYDNTAVNEYSIGMLAEKAGTYTVKYNVVDLEGNVISKHSMKVYAYKAPVTSLTLGGKNWGLLSGTSGKVSVKMDSKNPLKKIEYGYYKKVEFKEENRTETNAELVYKTVKNNGTVKYSKKPYENSYEYSYSNNEYFSYNLSEYSNILAPTLIRVTYKDQYTKRNETYTQWFYKVMK